MKSLFAVLLAISAAQICPADPVDRAIVAAMKLSEVSNYSWTATVMDDAGTYDIDGKTDGHGWTWLRTPMVKAIAQRLGRDADVQIEALFNGDKSFVIRTEGGWKTLGELPKRSPDWQDVDTVWVAPRSASAGWGSRNWGMPGSSLLGPDDALTNPFPVILATPGRPDESSRPYSNLQFGISRPQDELAVVVSSFTDIKVERNVAAGTLSRIGAQLLLVHDGQDGIQVGDATGAFRLFMENGVVTRYLIQLEGILFVKRKEVRVRQSTSTVIREIGGTSFAIPEEARRKLND